MNEQASSSTAVDLVTSALKVPGVKVNRKLFLLETFPELTLSTDIEKLLKYGPIKSGLYTQHQIQVKAAALCNKRKLQSSLTSFTAGLPGGWAMAATIPADTLQFWGFNLRIAQELAYLYGYNDFWNGEVLNEDAVQSELMLFLATMLGVGGAASVTRYVSQALAKQLAVSLPKQALTKTVYYPLIKTMASYVGIKLTKDSFARGVAKVVPVAGGVISGSLTYFTMNKMSKRLSDAFDVAVVYTEDEIKHDIEVIKSELPDVYDVIFTDNNDSKDKSE